MYVSFHKCSFDFDETDAKVSRCSCTLVMQRFHWVRARWPCKGFTGRIHTGHAKGFTGRMHAGHAKDSLGAYTLAMQRLHWAHACRPCKGFTGRKHAGHAKVSLGTFTLATQNLKWLNNITQNQSETPLSDCVE